MGDSQPQTSNVPDIIYPVGKILDLKIASPRYPAHWMSVRQVKINHQQLPWTLSCGMVVEAVPAPLGEAQHNVQFLKLFDRRGAEQLREENGLDSWTETVDLALLEGLKSGVVQKFMQNLRTVPNFLEDTEDDWDVAENETYLITKLRKSYDSEIDTYARLQDCQGVCIPRLLDVVCVNKCSPPKARLNRMQETFFQPTGLLLEYLPGFTLSDMINKVPRSLWQSIVDRAIEIVNIISDHGVLNEDVRPDNFIIVPKDGTYQVFMIDFGMCKLRRDDESDAEWGRKKWDEDEAGAVGVIMQTRLKKVGFDLQFDYSPKYLEWAPGEDD